MIEMNITTNPTVRSREGANSRSQQRESEEDSVKIQNTKYKIQNIKYNVQNTKYKTIISQQRDKFARLKATQLRYKL